MKNKEIETKVNRFNGAVEKLQVLTSEQPKNMSHYSESIKEEIARLLLKLEAIENEISEYHAGNTAATIHPVAEK